MRESKKVTVIHEYVKERDPNALINIIEAKEILGTGFKSIEE